MEVLSILSFTIVVAIIVISLYHRTRYRSKKVDILRYNNLIVYSIPKHLINSNHYIEMNHLIKGGWEVSFNASNDILYFILSKPKKL